MQQLQRQDRFNREGKMYGVLLVQTPEGTTAFLKAFSGLLQGQALVPGWVPPIPGRAQVALQEAYTLNALDRIKCQLLDLQHLPERRLYIQSVEDFDRQRQALNQRHRQRRLERHRQRQQVSQALRGPALQEALVALDQASRGDKAELRAFKQARTQQLAPLANQLQAADQAIATLKQQRKRLSRQLQADLHRAYSLTNFAGQSLALQDLAGPLPTGTGDCCAPKLLHFAAQHGLVPLAMAEFWWGPTTTSDKQPGQFYGACIDRCQPIMGFMLAGLATTVPQVYPDQDLEIPILYGDDWLVVVNKPAGLLAVPGRYGHSQDSVLSRLRHQLADGSSLVPVHRLDQDTSGVLVLARQKAWEGPLRQRFQTRQVKKTYEAILEGQIPLSAGMVTLPLWGNPQERPRQFVDWQRGKPCQTRYQVVAQDGDGTRVELYPLTGRTHQLRVHAAHSQGLNAPIRGDRLYGQAAEHPGCVCTLGN
jgi:tRNA pseudouridine32 synthase/23S rRNA pseudouridine746 synthase